MSLDQLVMRAKKQNTSVAMRTLSAQILISGSHFSIKGIRTPWKNGYSRTGAENLQYK